MLLLTLTNLLPVTWRPYAKTVWPALAALAAAIVHGLVTGTVRTLELEIALVGLLASAAALLTTNGPEGLRAYAKAIVPAVLTIAAVLVHWLVTGEWDHAQWALALTGLGSAFLTLLTPNVPEAPPGELAAAPAPEPGTSTHAFTPVAIPHDEDGEVAGDDLPTDEEEFGAEPDDDGQPDPSDDGDHDADDVQTDDVLPEGVLDLALVPGETSRPEGGVVPDAPPDDDLETVESPDGWRG